MNGLDAAGLAGLAVYPLTTPDYDEATQTVTAQDFERTAGGKVKIVSGAVVRKLTLTDIPAETLAARAAVALAAAQASAIRAIDTAAENARLRFVTPGAGQAMAYQEKSAEAADCLGAHDAQNPPPAGKYVLLESEVGITGADVLAVASAVEAKRQALKALEATINRTRLQAKADVNAAVDAAAVQVVLDGLTWPEPV